MNILSVEAIENARRLCGLSQTKAASIIGYKSRETYTKYINQENMKLQARQIMTDYFKCNYPKQYNLISKNY